MTTLKYLISCIVGLVLGGLLVWAHMSDLVTLCRAESVRAQADLQDMQSEHKAMAGKLITTQRERSAAYAELGRELGRKVDLTIPFKPVKPEQVSRVQIETNEIAGLAKMVSKFETAFKLATRGR